jgi:hypothetical protein
MCLRIRNGGGLLKYGKLTLTSITDWEFVDWQSVILAFEGGLCFMGLVSELVS